MNKPPAFQFYADDFIAGVADMTQNEVGAYIMLLAHGWNTGGLKAGDNERLKILAKGEISDHVLGKFKLKNGRLLNPRQEKERKKQSEYRDKQRINGALGGRPTGKPKPNPSLSFGLTQTEPKKSSPSPSPSPSPKDCIYSPESRVALHYLNEKSGRSFRESESSLSVIQARLSEQGVDITGVQMMIDRQCRRWKGTKQEEYLRPETLFGKQKFDGYYAAKDLPIHENDTRTNGQRVDRSIGTANEGIASQYANLGRLAKAPSPQRPGD